MIPSVGRTVHFFPGMSKHKGQPYPAVITHVWSDQCVNLHVLDDGSFPLGRPTVTSVMKRNGDLAEEVWDWPTIVEGRDPVRAGIFNVLGAPGAAGEGDQEAKT